MTAGSVTPPRVGAPRPCSWIAQEEEKNGASLPPLPRPPLISAGRTPALGTAARLATPAMGTARNPGHYSARMHAPAHLSLIVLSGLRAASQITAGTHPLWREKVWRLATKIQQGLGRTPGPEPTFRCCEIRVSCVVLPSPLGSRAAKSGMPARSSCPRALWLG